jgi:hypothetical protein
MWELYDAKRPASKIFHAGFQLIEENGGNLKIKSVDCFPGIIIIIIIISCHRFSFFPGTSPLEPLVNLTTQTSSLSL